MSEYPVHPREFETVFGTRITVLLRDDTSDFNNVNAILDADEYNFKAVPFEDGDIVIDIGAHIGSASLLLASLGIPNMKILAYEPLPENVELIKQNARINNYKNIYVFPYAVNGKAGLLKIYYGDESTVSGRHHHFIGNSYGSPGGRSWTAPVVSLDDIFTVNRLEHCKLIKFDSEGEEVNTLQICSKEVLSSIDYLVGEHHNVKREKIVEITRGVFDDMPCPWQTEDLLGHFWFRRKGLK